MHLIRLSALLACMATPAAAEWQLHRLTDQSAGTSEVADEHVLHFNCVRHDSRMYLELYPIGMDRSASDGLSALTVAISLPDGRSETVVVNLATNRDGFHGDFPVRHDWLAAFKDGQEMTISRSDTGQRLLRSDMKGTGAARILFAERCGI